jgi:hypothetical protein
MSLLYPTLASFASNPSPPSFPEPLSNKFPKLSHLFWSPFPFVLVPFYPTSPETHLTKRDMPFYSCGGPFCTQFLYLFPFPPNAFSIPGPSDSAVHSLCAHFPGGGRCFDNNNNAAFVTFLCSQRSGPQQRRQSQKRRVRMIGRSTFPPLGAFCVVGGDMQGTTTDTHVHLP